MGSFVTWREWLAIREDNARKRAVRAALSGTGRKLPGSYAACPSTNPRAMDSAQKTGFVQKQPNRLKIETEQKPNYSIDRWVQMAQELGDDVNKLVGHGKEEEDNLDKAKQQKEKDQPEKEKPQKKPAPQKSSQEQDEDKDKASDEDAEGKQGVWKSLRQIHQERLQKLKQAPKQASSGKSSAERA